MRYVLIHGSWHGPWCWQPLVEILEEAGHTIECVALPYSPSGTNDHVEYGDYLQVCRDAIMKGDEKPIVVAHSMSGIIAGPLSDLLGDHIKHTVFVSAFLPGAGETLLDVAMQFASPELIPIMRMDDVNLLHEIDREGAKTALYGDCPPQVQDWASSRLRSQPVKPILEKMEWDDVGKNASRRTYVICEEDKAVSVAAQEYCLSKHPCRQVRLKCGHFPFLSTTQDFAVLLQNLD